MNGNQLSLLVRSYNYGFVRNFCLHGRFYGLIDRTVTSGWTCMHVFVRAIPGRQCICWTLLNLWFSFLGFWVCVSSANRAVPLLDPDSESGTMFPSRGTCHRTAIPATMAVFRLFTLARPSSITHETNCRKKKVTSNLRILILNFFINHTTCN
jgi:hypothetical protein